MNCVIIEDEKNAAEHLQYQLSRSGTDVKTLAVIDSVSKAVPWLRSNTPDLIFMDIHLGDGLSFELFDHVQVKTPVIFTTSYDQYAIKAFEVNSIAYLLKPVKLDHLKESLAKYQQFYGATVNEKIVPLNTGYQKRFLVQSGQVMMPLPVEEIACFQVQGGKYVVITTSDNRQFLVDSTLEILEKRLDPAQFFRINRQFIINISSVMQIHPADNSKLKVICQPESKDEMLVSKEKAPAFKAWINQ